MPEITKNPGASASGALTDTQLRATAVPVSGPLTDTELRATPVPVTGAVTGPLTDLQMRATPVPVAGAMTLANGQPVALGSTTDDAASSTEAETTTARTGIGLLKGIKNILILAKAILGATDGAAVVTDADGTLQQYLRGLVKLIAAGTSVTASGTVTADQGAAGASAWPVTQAAPAAIYAGQNTVAAAGTEEAIGSSQAITQGVWVKALDTNTNNVFVGPNPVTSTTGYILAPGQSVFIPVANVATVYVDATTTGEGVSWIAS